MDFLEPVLCIDRSDGLVDRAGSPIYTYASDHIAHNLVLSRPNPQSNGGLAHIDIGEEGEPYIIPVFVEGTAQRDIGSLVDARVTLKERSWWRAKVMGSSL